MLLSGCDGLAKRHVIYSTQPNHMLRATCIAVIAASASALLTGSRVALSKGASPAHPLVLTQTIAQLSDGKRNGLKCTPAEAAELEEIIGMLERQNPTQAPAESALMDGSWRLLYTSTKGGSAGKLGPFVGKVKQVMDHGAGTYCNVLQLRGVRATLAAHWDVVDPSTWKVIFDSISFRVLGKQLVKKPFPPSQTGIWRMTYLDERVRVLRASGSNTPDVENVYVLAKEPEA